MAVETALEREILLADFGVSASYTPAGGSSSTITGILENEYEAVDAGGTVSFAVQRPRFICRSADVSSAAEGDALSISGVSYIVRVVMPDGTGITELMLEVQ
jgi:hypothetical protein